MTWVFHADFLEARNSGHLVREMHDNISLVLADTIQGEIEDTDTMMLCDGNRIKRTLEVTLPEKGELCLFDPSMGSREPNS